jgi:LysR family nitrogen assimilation transcriptional regulator
MELRQLRYFIAIVDHGSLSRAATGLHIAQPALTQQIHLLEDELGVLMLHRSSRGVLPTDAGRKFYEHALAIMKQVGDCKAGMAQLANHPSGFVALGIPQSVSSILALPLLKAARERHPEITIQLTEELSGTLIEQLFSGRLNLAILFDDDNLGKFKTTAMVDEKMMLITSANSRFAPFGSSIALAEALALPLILPSLQHGVRPRIEQLARAEGLELQNVIEINSVGILKSALMADLGVTIQAIAPMMPEAATGQLIAFDICGPIPNRHIALCASKDIPLNSAATAIERLVLSVVDMQCRSGNWPNGQSLTVCALPT